MEVVDTTMTQTSSLALATSATSDTTTVPLAALDVPTRAASGQAENIAVCIRVRPLNEREVRHKDTAVLRTLPAMRLISITDSDGQPLQGKQHVFQYDHIFDEHASTRAMYARVAQRIVKSSLDGINGTIFAYGQTSSGKTHTMTGTGGLPFQQHDDDEPSKCESMGILQLAVEDIFGYIEQSTDRDFLLRVSFVEIYNEVVKDLLTDSDKGHNLKLREDPRKGVYVESKEEIITNYEDILRLLHVGNQRRTVGTTAMNDKSSRSHSIFRIVIESKEKSASRRQSEDDVNGAVLVASLSLVDLAGSESMRHTAAEGARQREAGNINKSLLTLSRVINSLATAGPAMQNAPFRDSKLTRLLQNSLDGNTRTLIICCVTPSDRYLEETKSTLQFAARAKTIQTSASVNEVLDDQAQLKRLKREVHELKRLVNSEAYDALKAENEALQNEQNKNKTEITRLLGLMLSSSSASVRGLASARNVKPRHKRTRETWAPGDFSSNLVLKSLRTDFSSSISKSPNPQPRKRPLPDDVKENVDPQNLLSALDEADDGDEDDDEDSIASRRGSSGSHHSSSSSRRGQEERRTTHLVERLENAISHNKKSRSDEDEKFLAADDLETRVARLVGDCEALASVARQHEQLAGDHEVLKMATEELQMRLQLSKDQETEELDNTKQLLEHVKTELAEAREGDQLREEELQKEKESWLLDRKQMESTISELRSQLEALSGLGGRSGEVEESVRELTRQNEALKEDLSTVKQAAEQMQHTHAVKFAELETNTKREIEELSTQLQGAFVELEELKLEKEEEITKLEEELLAQSDELDQKLVEFGDRENRFLHEIEGLKLKQNASGNVDEDNESLSKRCEELAIENERLTSERSNLMDAMVELEEQLQQTNRAHSALEEQVNCLNGEKADVATQLAALERKLENLQRERDSAVAQANEIHSSTAEDASKRIKELEQELARAQTDLEEASNDQDAEANRADEAVQELEKVKLEMEDLVQQHARTFQENVFSSSAQQDEQASESEIHRLTALLSEKDIQIKQAEAAAAEACSYRDFLQAELDELSQKVSGLETAKSHFANENAHLRQQLTEINHEMLQVPETLAGELDELTERIESLGAELDTKIVHEKILTTEIKKLMHKTADQESQLADKATEVTRLQEAIQTLDEEKSAWLHKSASSDELQAELVRMREERWGLATKWEESEAALGKERRESQRLASELQDLQTDHEGLEEEKNALTELLAEKKTKLRQLSSELDATQTEKAALEELASELESKFEILEIAKKSLNESLSVRVAELATKANENAELTTKLDATESELKTMRQKLEESHEQTLDTSIVQDLHTRIQQLEASQASSIQDVDEAKRAKSNLVEVLSALEAQLMVLSEEKIDLNSKLDSTVSLLDESASKSAEASEKIASLTRELEATRAELTQVGASKTEMLEAHEQLQKHVDDLKSSLLEKEQQLHSSTSSVLTTTESNVAELTLQLEAETQRRAKAELDAKSYEEALDLMRDDFMHKLDALKSSQLAIQESNASKQTLEEEMAKLQRELARANEEQAELRYQNQQRLLSTQGTESVLKETMEMLEQELTTTKETLARTDAEWKARAQQAEQQFRRMQAELQAMTTKESAAREKLARVEEQLTTTKDALVETENEWKERAQQAEQQFRRLEDQLRSVKEDRTRLAELEEQVSTSQDEIERFQSAHEALKVAKKQLEDHVASRERHWAERVDEVTRKSQFENSSLRVQCQEAQDEVTAFKQFAEGQIAELRATIEQNDNELLERSRIAKQREDMLQQHVEELENKLEELRSHARALQNKLSESDATSGEVVAELSHKVDQLTEQLADVELERDSQMDQFAKLKAAMEKLEGEDYQHRNELEELSETLKSAQMEAMHYHNQLVEIQQAKDKVDNVVAVQQRRIDKLEQVKMTNETFAVFHKIKSERQALQVQVETLTTQLKDAVAAKALTKEAAEHQQNRLLRLKEDEVGLLKTHVGELKTRVEELTRAVDNEKLRNSQMQSELEAAVCDIRDKAQREVDDLRVVLQEKSDHVVELQDQLDTLTKDKHAMVDHKSAKESYLEKENLELLVENRQLKKRLDSRAPASTNGSSYRTAMLDDDVAAFEASAKAASALLAEPSAASAYASVTATTPEPPLANHHDEKTTPASSATDKVSTGGLSSFLLPSSATANDTEDEEARPACSQQ